MRTLLDGHPFALFSPTRFEQILSISTYRVLTYINIIVMTTLTKQESSGLSSKIKAREAAPQSQDVNEQSYTFTIDATIPDLVEVPKTQCVIPNDMKLAEASKIALQKIKLQLEQMGVFVSTDIQKYKPRLARKNGKAKSDMPCLDYDQILIDMKIKAVCLDPKDQSCVYLLPIEFKQSKQSNITFQKPMLFTTQEKREAEVVGKSNSKENFDTGPYASAASAKETPPPKEEPKCMCLLF